VGEDQEAEDHEQPEPELAHHHDQQVGKREVRLVDPVDQTQRQRDRHRVIDPDLRLQRAGQTPTDARELQRGKHSRGVRGRHHRAEQHRLTGVAAYWLAV
jgi:hypothetical protein